MSAVSNFTPLFGADATGPYCYLLRCDEYTLLLDCGWDESWDINLLSSLQPLITQIDAVLISHCSLPHLGALPYVISKMGLTAPIYATVPIQRMGSMVMYDAYQQLPSSSTTSPIFTLDDIDVAFDDSRMHCLKYSEDFLLADKLGSSNSLSRLMITPHSAGHSIGGTLWRIHRENEIILYAVNYNHSKERYLNSGVVEAFTRPSLLIMDCSTLGQQLEGRKQREKLLLETIQETVVLNQGIALLPIDSVARVLELLLIIHGLYEKKTDAYSTIPFIFLSPQSSTTLEFARGLLEWMADAIQKHFDMERGNAFQLQYLKTAQTYSQVETLTAGFTKPAIILATSYTLHTSLALQIMETIANQPQSKIILTQPAPPTSLASQLLQFISSSQPSSSSPNKITYTKKIAVPLKGEELVAFQQQQKMEQEQQQLENQTINMEQDADDDDADEEDISIIDKELQPPTSILQQMQQQPLIIKEKQLLLQQQLQQQQSLMDGHSALSFYVFPFNEPKRIATDRDNPYGEAVEPQQLWSNLQQQQQQQQQHASALITDTHKKEEPQSALTVVPPASIPTKTIDVTQTITLYCRLSHIDFSGRSDGRSWKIIVGHVRPRKLILIHGAETDKQNMKQFVLEKHILSATTSANIATGGTTITTEAEEKTADTPMTAADAKSASALSASSSILIPGLMQCMDITGEQLFRATLHPSLLSSLQFTSLNDYEIAYTQAKLHIDQSQANLPQLVPVTNTSLTSSTTSSLVSSSSANASHASVFLGDYRFSDFRRVLSANGIDSEFYVKGGVLAAANGTVRIKKSSPTQISIEGIISEQYYTVRALLYAQYTRV